jgi:mRNA interferase MazF
MLQQREYKRGQIWIANLSGGIGSEQNLTRPVIVVQNNIANKFSPTITIVPMTKQDKKWLPTHVKLHKTMCLSSLSTALVEQVTTISKERLKNYLGEIEFNEMIEIERGLMIQLGIVETKNKVCV